MFENDIIKTVKINNRQYIQFKMLNELGIKNSFAIKPLNFSFKNQSKEDNKHNIKILCDDMNLNFERLTRPIQTHSKNIKIITNKYGINIDFLNDTDAIITKEKNIPLMVTTADCIPIIIYDKEKRIIAAVHSGWRGTYKNITIRTIKKMQEIFNSKQSDLLIFFAPSICKDCFEVDSNVENLFIKKYGYLKNINEIITKVNDKFHIDTVLLIKTLLIKNKIPQENIFISNICTCHNSEIMHSCRACNNKNFGLNATVISL